MTPTSRPGWTPRRVSSGAGEDGLRPNALKGSRTGRARVARAVFPPQQVAEAKAIAWELPAAHGRPLGRFSRTELHRLVIERGVCEASASTIWRWLHDDAITASHGYRSIAVIHATRRILAVRFFLDHGQRGRTETVGRHLDRVERDIEHQQGRRDRLVGMLEILGRSREPSIDQFIDAIEPVTVITDATEIARILGITRQKAKQVAESAPDFPPPEGEHAGRPVCSRRQIEASSRPRRGVEPALVPVGLLEGHVNLGGRPLHGRDGGLTAVLASRSEPIAPTLGKAHECARPPPGRCLTRRPRGH